jgi:glycine/D-amino acid oxidase-like deaminating enzyme
VRVAVIGCGLIGAAVARELQLRGAQTVVYEARGPGAGSSGTTFAWVNAHDKTPRTYHELNVAGIQAHLELHARAGPGNQWFFPTGNLAWTDAADDEARLAHISARLESWGYPVRRMTPTAACELEPDLRVADRVDRLLFFPSEGYVLPTILLAHLLGDALDRGAELRCPALVEAVTLAPEGVRLQLGNGSVDVVDVAVSCVGRWTAGLMARAGHSLPMADPDAPGSATVGYLAYTRPTPIRLNRVLTAPRLNVRPDGGGRLVLQGLDLDSAADPAVAVAADGSIAQEFVFRLSQVVRGAEGVELEAIRVGQRALPADGLTVAGHLDESGRLYVVATHSGVTLGPLLGRLAATEIISGSREDVLAPFRPQRFLAPEAAQSTASV